MKGGAAVSGLRRYGRVFAQFALKVPSRGPSRTHIGRYIMDLPGIIKYPGCMWGLRMGDATLWYEGSRISREQLYVLIPLPNTGICMDSAKSPGLAT